MQVIYTRKNRKTRQKIELCVGAIKAPVWPYKQVRRYWAQCQHGNKSFKYRRKSSAIDNMAHPDKWCDKCYRIIKEAKAEGK